jgi:hypothetical protein
MEWQVTGLATPTYAKAAARGPIDIWIAILMACVAAAAVIAPIVALTGAYVIAAAAAVGGGLVVAIVLRPQYAAYIYLLATPLIVGIARGDALPILRPNEALLAVILLGLGCRAVLTMLQGKPYRFPVDGIDLIFILLAVCASALPLALRWGRGEPISSDDILYAIVLWKYYAIYRIFRESVTTEQQVGVCLWLSLASALIVALIAILQVSNLFGVPEFLFAHFDNPFQATARIITDRGTSTIASSFGVADTMMINLAIVMVMLCQRHPNWRTLLIFGGIFVFGCIAAGQFSGYIGLAVTILTVGVVTGRLRQTLAVTVPVACVAIALLWPVLAERLSGFHSLSGLPSSWVNRLENLERFFLDELFSGLNWLTGVRPSARIATPEPWREWVYIESGYLWLLWTGGVPLVTAYILFIWNVQRKLRRVIGSYRSSASVAAIASLSWAITMSLLMVLDPHLTMRGAADLFYPLLALSFVGAPSQAARITEEAADESREPR